MILEKRQSFWLRGISALVWRWPGRPAAKMAGFSHTEYGSGLDMLSAVQETPRRELRAKYYQHALDELIHSQLFRERAQKLSSSKSRAQAVLNSADFILSHGIRGSTPLFRQMTEIEFLAFVWLHERRGAQQFDIYAELMQDDDESRQMFERIAKDERFHISYSRRELDKAIKAGHGKAVKKAIFKIRSRRLYQAWLRFGRSLGTVVSGLWLGLIYLLLIGPFSLIAKSSESKKLGFQSPAPRMLEAAKLAGEQG